jgi:uncharacterized protein with HEPN domain
MKDEILKDLHDIRQAISAIRTFVAGKSFSDYVTDELLRSGVERKFEIIGEVLNRIQRNASDVLSRIRNHRDIISFRNILVHGYDSIDDRIVWGIIEEHLDLLEEDIGAILRDWQGR